MNKYEIIKLEIPCSPQYLSFIRNSVDALKSNLGISDDQLGDVKIAINEACTNAVKYAEPKDCPITVSFHIMPDALEIEVRSAGVIDRQKTAVSLPPVSNFPENGYGLYIINQAMDEFEIIPDSSEVVVRMVKKTRQ